MELGEPEPLGVLHHHGRGLRHVDPDLDDRRGHEHLDSTVTEGGDGGGLRVSVHPPVQHPEPEPAQGPRGQLLRGLQHGPPEPPPRYPRTHDEGALVAGRGGGDRVVGDSPPIGTEALGDDIAPARALVQDREVEIAVERQREGPRDRRRGHGEQVRRAALLEQPRALEHTEALLLVDDHEAQVRESHGLLHEGVRAHHDARLAAPDRRLGRPPPRRPVAAREVADGHAPGFEESPRSIPPLRREDLRGREHRDLAPPVDHGGCRDQADDRLAAAHVALQEPLHRLPSRQLPTERRHRAPLGTGQCERQRADDAVDQARGGPRLHGVGEGCAAPVEGRVQDEQVLPQQGLVRRVGARAEAGDVVGVGGEVDGAQGLRARGEPEALADLGGDDVGHRGEAFEGLRDEPPERPHPETVGGRVDRHHHAAVDARRAACVLVLRVVHAQRARPTLDRPHEDHLPPGDEERGDVGGRSKPAHQQRARPVLDEHLDEPGTPSTAATYATHGREHDGVSALHELAHGGGGRAVAIVPRDVVQEVRDGVDAEPRELVAPGRTDPPEGVDERGRRGDGAAQMNSTLRIETTRLPFGTLMVTSSSISLPSRARPMGDSTEMRPSFRSAS